MRAHTDSQTDTRTARTITTAAATVVAAAAVAHHRLIIQQTITSHERTHARTRMQACARLHSVHMH